MPKPGPLTREQVSRAVALAASRLGAETLELLQFHAWNYADPSYLDGLFFLDELRAEGRIQNIGLTNCDAAHLEMLLTSGLEIVSNQVCFSALDRRAAGAMTSLCVERGVSLLAYGTLAGGLLTERFLDVAEPDVAELETWSLMKYRRFVETAGGWSRFQHVLRGLAEIASRLDISLANLATRYVLEQPAVAAVIDKIEGALQSLGGRLEDVVRTRIFVPRIEQWDAIARTHGQRFGEVLPANTMVQAALIGDEFLVEIEAEAVVVE